MTPLTHPEFDVLMEAYAPWGEGVRLAVAVSGGADSVALTLLAHSWARERGVPLTALSVDHGLRPESKNEVQQVHLFFQARGIAHEPLTWAPPPLTTRVQERARAARFELLLGYCRTHNISHLLLGHHQDDQFETQLFRLARGSTLLGMSGMSGQQERGGVRVLRPLLTVPKKRLADFLRHEKISWIEDPSNHNPRFARTGLRKVLANHAFPFLEEGPRLQRIRSHMEGVLAHLLDQLGGVDQNGVGRLDRARLLKLPSAWQRLVMARMLTTVGGLTYAPRQERLKTLIEALSREPFVTRTCGGCLVLAKKESLWVVREAGSKSRHASSCHPCESRGPEKVKGWIPAFAGMTQKGAGMTGESAQGTQKDAKATERDLTLAMLGHEGLLHLKKSTLPALKNTPYPRQALLSLPAFWSASGELLCVPGLNYVVREVYTPLLTCLTFCPPCPLKGSFWSAPLPAPLARENPSPANA